MRFYKIEFSPFDPVSLKDLTEKGEAVFNNGRGTLIIGCHEDSELEEFARMEGALLKSEAAMSYFLDLGTTVPNPYCHGCRKDLGGDTMKMYPHSSGHFVKGHLDPQWVYYECPDCSHQTSWSGLSVARHIKE